MGPEAQRGGLPRYVRIAAVIRAEIAAGHYQLGGRIPSEPDLRAQFGVSKTTADAALRRLTDEGWITRRPGLGSYVIAVPEVHVVECGPGCRIMMRPARPGEIPGALEAGVSCLVIERPGGATETYPSDATIVITVREG